MQREGERRRRLGGGHGRADQHEDGEQAAEEQAGAKHGAGC
jgi:hypothetical protein